MTRGKKAILSVLALLGCAAAFAILMAPPDDRHGSTPGGAQVRSGLGMTALLLVWAVPVYLAAWWLGEYRSAAVATVDANEKTSREAQEAPATTAPRDSLRSSRGLVAAPSAAKDLPRATSQADRAPRTPTQHTAPVMAALPLGRPVDEMAEVAAPRTYYLIVAAGSSRGLPLRISTDLYLMGADPICQYVDARLAPQHCALVTRLGKVLLCDLGGKESLVVNGEAISSGSEWPLHVGDMLVVGPVVFLVQYRETPLSGKDLEEWAASCLDAAVDRDDLEYDIFRAQATSASEAAKRMIQYLKARNGEMVGRLRVAWETDDTLLVRFNDEDLVEGAELALVRQELCACAEGPGLRLLLDFKNVRRLSLAGLAVLGEVSRQLRHRGCRLAACRLRPEIQEVAPRLEAAEIRCFPNKAGALAAAW